MFLTGSLPSVNLMASTSRSASTVKGDYCLRFLTFKYDDCDKDLYIGGVYIVLDRMKVKSLNNWHTNIANNSIFLCEIYSRKTSTKPQPMVSLYINTS